MAQSDSGMALTAARISNMLATAFRFILHQVGKAKGKELATASDQSPSSSIYSSRRTRIKRLIQMRSTFPTDLEFEIESSKEHWSLLTSLTATEAAEEVDLLVEQGLLTGSKEIEEWKQLVSTCATKEDAARVDQKLLTLFYGRYDYFFSSKWLLGRKIAEGSQAELYTAGHALGSTLKCDCRYVLKVFKRGFPLRDLLKHLQKKVITGYCTTYTCPIWSATVLPDGRLALRMQKYWGDLRKLLDLRMQYGCNSKCLPFSYSETIRSMEFIAKGMRDLHNVGIIHRDLKASNVLVEFTYNPGRKNKRCRALEDEIDPVKDAFDCRVGDFESSGWVVGTGFWRAPEILLAEKNGNITRDLFTQKSDVYSYGMTCYEILTGCIPFENLGGNNSEVVIQGARPKLPKHVERWMLTMFERCWHQNPLERPTFQELSDLFDNRKGCPHKNI